MQGCSYAANVAQTIGALVAVCLLAVLGIRLWGSWWSRRQGKAARLEQLESLRLPDGANLHLVRVDGRDLLVASSSGGVAVHELAASKPRGERSEPSQDAQPSPPTVESSVGDE